MSKQSIAIIIMQGGAMKPYRISEEGKFFVIHDKFVSGIFHMNGKYKWMWDGKCAVYFYSIGEMNNIEPIMINEINKFAEVNQLSKINHKHIQHGSNLRLQINKISREQNNGDATKTSYQLAHEAVQVEAKQRSQQITEIARRVNEFIQLRIDEQQKNYGKSEPVSDEYRAIAVLENLKKFGLITESQYEMLYYKINNSLLDYQSMMLELVNSRIVDIAEPLDMKVESFIEHIESQDAKGLARIVKNLRSERKGLRGKTCKPVTQWVTSAILIGSFLASLVVPFVLRQFGVVQFPQNILGLVFIIGLIILVRFHFPSAMPPYALVFFPNGVLKAYQMKKKSSIFVLNTPKYKNVYLLDHNYKCSWNGKASVYLFQAFNSEKVSTVINTLKIKNARPKFNAPKFNTPKITMPKLRINVRKQKQVI